MRIAMPRSAVDRTSIASPLFPIGKFTFRPGDCKAEFPDRANQCPLVTEESEIVPRGVV
jgi:hypothetical protein